MKKSNNPPTTIVNPAALAESRRGEPLPHVDHLVTGENGTRKIAPDARFREEAVAVNLGHGAGQDVYDDALIREVDPVRSEHQGLEAQLEAAEPRRRPAEQLHVGAANLVAALRAVPLNAIDPQRKQLNNLAKVLLITGDTSVIADQVYRATTPIWLAIPLGLSLAASVVAIGAKCGHEIAAALSARIGARRHRAPWRRSWPSTTTARPRSGTASGCSSPTSPPGPCSSPCSSSAIGAGDSAKLAVGYAAPGLVDRGRLRRRRGPCHQRRRRTAHAGGTHG